MKKQDIKNALVKKTIKPAKPTKPRTIADWLNSESFKEQVKRVLPKVIDPERLLRISLSVYNTNAQLKRCTPESFLSAVMQSAQLGLEPNVLGECYFVPYKDKVQFIVGYKGLLKLIRRSGEVKSLRVHIVYENDYFKLKYGLEEDLEHIPYFAREDKKFDDGGEIKGVYMVVKLKSGEDFIHYMPLKEILKRRDRSPSARSSHSPWATDFEAMLKKTVVRDAFKWLPSSIEVQQALVMDETVKTEIAEDMTLVSNEIEFADADFKPICERCGVVVEEGQTLCADCQKAVETEERKADGEE